MNTAIPSFPTAKTRSFYMVVHDESMLALIPLYTATMTLGEQDRMALMCIYDFEDWNP